MKVTVACGRLLSLLPNHFDAFSSLKVSSGFYNFSSKVKAKSYVALLADALGVS